MKIRIEIKGTDEGIGSSELGNILHDIAERFRRDREPGEGEMAQLDIEGWDVNLEWVS